MKESKHQGIGWSKGKITSRYLKDYISGERFRDVHASGVHEISSVNPPTTWFSSNILLSVWLAFVQIASEEQRISKD